MRLTFNIFSPDDLSRGFSAIDKINPFKTEPVII